MSATCTPAAAFDAIAQAYDHVFTESAIGRAQRGAVWREIDRCFAPGERVLEINCGTGIDALFLASRGVHVDAFDVSPEMVRVARANQLRAAIEGHVSFARLATEELHRVVCTYEGALSNFGGLNCVADISAAATQLARLVIPGGRVLICLAGAACAWEVAWYGAQGRFDRAFRRLRRHADGHVSGGKVVPVFYPTARQLTQTFAPWFELERLRGIGVLVPPTYVEAHARRYPRLLIAAERADRWLGRTPAVRALADHIVLVFRRRTK